MEPARESFNPWSVVNVVFHHLAAQGLHPTLGGADPGTPAAELLRALGIEPAPEGDRQVGENVKRHLAEIRAAVFDHANGVGFSAPSEGPGIGSSTDSM